MNEIISVLANNDVPGWVVLVILAINWAVQFLPEPKDVSPAKLGWYKPLFTVAHAFPALNWKLILKVLKAGK